MKGRILAIVMSAVLVCALAGCGAKEEAASGTSPVTEEQTDNTVEEVTKRPARKKKRREQKKLRQILGPWLLTIPNGSTMPTMMCIIS